MVLDLVYRPWYASDITYVLHLKNKVKWKKQKPCILSNQPDKSSPNLIGTETGLIFTYIEQKYNQDMTTNKLSNFPT